jgi:Lrp/AsnC family transcriptional regulator of ectoine degradation
VQLKGPGGTVSRLVQESAMTLPKLDSIDLAILAILQREGRITKAALAERVNLSATPCWERLKRLEAAGIIAGYAATLSLKAFARATMVMMEVTLRSHRQADFDRFERAVRGRDEVIDCWAVGGGVDYMVRVVASDVEAYQRFVDTLLEAEIGIDRYFTYVVTKTVKEAAPLPLDRLLPGGTLS